MSMYNDDRVLREGRYYHEADHRRGGGTGTMLSLLAGTAIGAVAMYLLDPDNGEDRRSHVGGYTGDALKGTGQTLNLAASQLAEKARELSASLAGTLGSAAGSVGTAASDVTSSAARSTSSAARSAYDSVADRTASLFGHQRQSNDTWLGDVESHDHSLTAPLVGAGAIGTTLLAVGALYLLDPEKRRVIMDNVNRVVKSTGETFHSLGQRVGAGGAFQRPQHMDYATSDDYMGTTEPEVGHSTAATDADVPPLGT